MPDNIIRRSGILLTILVLVMFTTKTLFIIPFFLLSFFGLAYIFTSNVDIRKANYRMLVCLFLLLWVPILLASIDAVDSSRAVNKILTFACFLPAGIFIIFLINNEKIIALVHAIIFIVLCVWMVDGTLQFFAGRDLFGYPYTPPQLMGMFYPKVRMPYFLAILAPVFFEFIRLRFNSKNWLILLLIPFGMMILLGGKRSAWIMLAFSGTGYLVYLYLLHKSISFKKVVFTAMLILFPLILLGLTHSPLGNRISSTLEIFSEDIATIDQASAHRIDLWKVAIAITRDHWLNGVGPRGYRQVFNKYADENNFWIRAGYPDGTTHPHLHILEIASEAGLIGLAGYILFYVLLFRLLFMEIHAGRLAAVPWLLCALTAFFPLNAHLAFYGSYWSSVSWWVLAVTLAVVYTRQDGKDPDH